MISVYTTPPHRREWLALAVILILAAALRMGAPGAVEFRRDEANLSERALNFVHGAESFPLLGIDSSVGIRNAPVSIWLLIPPYLVSSDPTLATEWIALLNVIAVLLAYGIARRYYGPLAAVTAGLLFAVSPWAVEYSRRIWNPDMLPMFILLTLGTGLVGFLEGKRWAQVLHLPLLALTAQIHYGTFILIPISGMLIWSGRRRLTRAFMFSIALAAITFLPYAIGAAQAGLLSAQSIQKVLAAGKASSGEKDAITFSDTTLPFTWFVLAGTDLEQIIGPQGAVEYRSWIGANALAPLLKAAALLILVAALWLIFRTVRHRDARSPVDVALLLLFILAPGVYLVTWTRMNIYYLVPMLPAAFLIAGVAVRDLWQGLAAYPARRLIFGVGGLALFALAAVQVWSTVATLDYFNTHITKDGVNAALNNEYLVGSGTPLGYYTPARADVLAQHPKSVLAALDGQYVGFNEETTSWNVLLYDVPLRRFLDNGIDVYPAEPSALLTHDCTDQTHNFPMRPGEGCYAVSTRQASDLDLSAYTPVPDADHVHFSNGLRILAYRWNATDDGCLSIVYSAAGPRPEDFTFAVHFLNAAGDKIAQADSPAWRGQYWRNGDRIVEKLCSQDSQQQKNDIAGVQWGMYIIQGSGADQQFIGSPLVDAQNKPLGDWLTVSFSQVF